MRRRTCVVIFLCSLSLAGCDKGKSTKELLGDLNSKNEGDRLKAVRNLPAHKGASARVVPALIESLKGKEDADVRLSAANGLGYFGAAAKSALPALEAAQNDRDARVRRASRNAILRIRGIESTLGGLQSAISAQNSQSLAAVSKQIEEKHSKGEISDAEFKALGDIIEKANAGGWEVAQKNARDLTQAPWSIGQKATDSETPRSP